MASKYALTGNWNDNTTWSTSDGGSNDTTKPTAADDVFLTANSGNIVWDVTPVCRSLNCTGYTGTLSGSAAVNIGDATAGASNIALKYSSGMTLSATSAINLISSSATQQTVTTAGIQPKGTFTVNSVGGSYIQADDFTTVTANSVRFAFQRGTWNMGGFNIQCDNMQVTGTNTRTFTMGSSTITLTGTGTVWNATTTTGLTWSNPNGSIVQTGGGGTHTFVGGGLTYGSSIYTANASTGLDVTGSNTFGTFTFTAVSSNRALRFTAGTTNTFTNFNVFGSSGARVLLSSITAATHTLSKSSGTVSSDHLSLTNSIAAGGATWYAGADSIDNGGNSVWQFVTDPALVVASPKGNVTSRKNLMNLRRL